VMEIKRKSAPAQKKPSPIGPVVAGIVAQSKAIADSATAAVVAVSRDRRALSIGAIVLGVVIVAGVATMLFSGPAPSGTVVIDAVPWGTITAIETEGGDKVALPSTSSTPLSLSLPAGTYQVVITGPPPELQTQRITIEIQRDGTTVAPMVRFRMLTPDEYFEQYLAAPTAPTLDGGVASVESAPAIPTQSSPVAQPTGSNP